MRLSRSLLFVFLGTALMVQSPSSAFACSCMMPESVQQSIDDASAVFLGTVKDVSAENDFRTTVTIAVKKEWKGSVSAGKNVKVSTANDSAACGYQFEEGAEYLVYAYNNEQTGDLSVSLCSATKLKTEAKEDLAVLADYSGSPSSPNCDPYKCNDGTQVERCSAEGYPINYFAPPCMTHGGEQGQTSTVFSDVPSTHANAEAIAYVRAQGIVEGYSDGTYRPDQNINRAEFAKILEESIPDAPNGVGLCPMVPEDFKSFSDVHNEWFWIYVCMQQGRGIVDGYSDGTFRPAENINFVEAAKMMYGASHLDDRGILVAEEKGSPWYQPYVVYLAERNAIPLSITSFDKKITRGEMAEIIWRIRTENTAEASMDYKSLVQSSR